MHTTNNRMELTAAIHVLSIIRNSKFIIHLYTDSSYLINGITKWVYGWRKNDWKTTQKKDVENRDLWEKLIDAAKGKQIEWEYVGGHVGVAGNVRCDENATSFADNKPTELYSGILENYGVKNILDVSPDVEARVGKRESRNRQKAKAYSYVSLVNGRVETYKNWSECEARVRGKRGARYKKALSADEEQALITQWSM